MIIIHKPHIVTENDIARLIFPLDIDEEHKELFVEVPENYKRYLCVERADAVVIGLLRYAMVNKHNMRSEIPVTEELLHNINEILLPTLVRNDPDVYPVKFECETASALKKLDHQVGTGLSCGADCFYTVLKHYNTKYKESDITVLTIFNAGSFNGIYRGVGIEYVKEKTWEHSERVAKELNLPLIKMNTNIHILFPLSHLYSHTYLNMFMVYILQQLWRKYYYASGYDYSSFSLENNLHKDPSYFEHFLLHQLSISNLSLCLSGAECKRIDKLEFISQYPIARDNVHVCAAREVNCGWCGKCRYTLLPLDAIDKLDDFKNAFDIENYKRHRADHYRFLCEQHVLNNARYQYYYKRAFEILYERHREEFDQYLSECTLENSFNKSRDLGLRLYKKRMEIRRIEKAIDKKLIRNLINHLKKKGIQSVSFYGDGDLRICLTKMFREYGLPIGYMVEDNFTGKSTFPVYKQTIPQFPESDLMIITDVLREERLKKRCQASPNIKNILTVSEFFEGKWTDEQKIHGETYGE